MRRVPGHLRPVEAHVADYDGDEADEAADDDADVDEPHVLGTEVVYPPEDEGDRGEEAEEGGELAGDVEADEGDYGLSEEHLDRAEQGDGDEQLDLGPDWRGRGQGDLELLRPPAAEDRRVCLAAPYHAHYYGFYVEEQHGPLGPSPSFSVDNESADQRARFSSQHSDKTFDI